MAFSVGSVLSAIQTRLDDDLAWRLVRDRYRAFDRLRLERGQSDGGESGWVTTRMLGRPAVVVSGAEGVRTFYDERLVTRKRALPAPVRLVLFGPQTIHRLEGLDHRWRKHLMVDLVTGPEIDSLTELVARGLDDALNHWTRQEDVDLFDELVRIYGRAVIEWVGSGASLDEADRISGEMAAILDGFGVGATPYPRAVVGRIRAERWALRVIRDVRAGRRTAAGGSVVDALASQRADQLSDVAAATELVNIMRPVIAVAYFGVFAAHALHEHPEWRDMVASGDERYLRAFEHEVRRWYPFAPLLGGRLKHEFEAGDTTLSPGSWIILDIRATNLDEGEWQDADRFDPARFLDREPSAYNFVPQGGGDTMQGHRCPGEPITIGVLQATLQRLAGVDYDVAPGRWPCRSGAFRRCQRTGCG
ncbi:MAG TPA: cytochrome P450 [Actinomycetes bacterium]|nr:cytochrome P450 [Actinomycetes bacterium]